jgi:hypothetical protein
MPPREATKLWHDDVRPAPEGWRWAQTNQEAQHILESFDVVECSLDHDLGAPLGNIFVAGHSPEGTGYDLVRWMIENNQVPAKVTIHSWSYDGARRMARALEDAGHAPVVAPYEVPREMNWIR